MWTTSKIFFFFYVFLKQICFLDSKVSHFINPFRQTNDLWQSKWWLFKGPQNLEKWVVDLDLHLCGLLNRSTLRGRVDQHTYCLWLETNMGNRIPVLHVSRAMQHLTLLQYWVHHTMCHQVERLSLVTPMGSFTLLETDSGTDSDSYSKPDGYIVLCRTCSHCTDVDSDPHSLYLCRTGIRVWVRQCKWEIMLKALR